MYKRYIQVADIAARYFLSDDHAPTGMRAKSARFMPEALPYSPTDERSLTTFGGLRVLQGGSLPT